MRRRRVLFIALLGFVAIVSVNIAGYLLYGSELERIAEETALSWYRKSLPPNTTIVSFDGGRLFLTIVEPVRGGNTISIAIFAYNAADKPYEFICEHEVFNVSGKLIDGIWIEILPWNLTIELSNGTSVKCCSWFESWFNQCLCEYESIAVEPLNHSITFRELPMNRSTSEGVLLTKICSLAPRRAMALELMLKLSKEIRRSVERIRVADACAFVRS